jgi:acetyl esterase/lipase
METVMFNSSCDRRYISQVSRVLVLAAVALLAPQVQSAEIRKVTHTYKRVKGLEIKADVYRDEGSDRQPVLVWIHGGALIMGNRDGIDHRFKNEFAASGTILVSIDYRLAPETQLPEIIADVEDAFRWVREKGPELFHADPDRIAVAGASAGGYLTLTAGFRVKPRPLALVPLFGYGSLVADWYAKPSTYPRHNPMKVTREEAYREVSGIPIADDRERKGNGGKFYLYCRQQGLWPKGVSGWDPGTEAEKFYPFMPIRNVTADYPPTFLIHGDNDTDVPHEESVLMAAELKKHDVPHRFVSIPQGEHGFGGADKKVVEEAYREAFAFLKERLKSGR